MPINILIINVHSALNKGDAALIRQCVSQLRSEFIDPTFTFVVNDMDHHNPAVEGGPAVSSLSHLARRDEPQSLLILFKTALFSLLLIASAWWVRFTGRIPKKSTPDSWRAIINAYAAADLIISCPGNFLYSSGRFGITLYWVTFHLKLAQYMKKPLYMMPQSIGPFSNNFDVWRVKKALQYIPLILARDLISLNLVESWFKQTGQDTQPTVDFVPDIAFALPPSSPKQGQALIQRLQTKEKNKSLQIGVTAINWGAQNIFFSGQARYEKTLVTALSRILTAHGGTAFLFSQVHGPNKRSDDRIPASRIYASLQKRHPNQIIFVEENLPLEELKAAYGQMDLFIGSRLHSCIFALSEKVPTFAIGYQHKTQGVMDFLGYADWYAPIETVEPENIEQFVESTLKNPVETKKKLANRMDQVCQEAGQAGRLIHDHFLKQREGGG